MKLLNKPNMKENPGKLFSAPRIGVGMLALALCAFAPASHAGVVINDINSGDTGGSDSYNNTSNPGPSADYIGQVFTMDGSGGYLSSVTLALSGGSGTPTAHVYVYNTSSGAPTGSYLYDLGAISASANTLTIANPTLDPLSASTTYAIVLDTSADQSLAWAWRSTQFPASGGSGSLGNPYWQQIGAWNATGSGYPYQMNVQAVPEVPMTGLLMGLGALGIAMGGILRGRLHRAFANIV